VHEHVRVDLFVAEGGFGRVYRGHHLTLDRAVAIKLLKVPEEYSEGMRAIFVERFAQEARIIAQARSPRRGARRSTSA
jgi:serine/threonine protein kinase